MAGPMDQGADLYRARLRLAVENLTDCLQCECDEHDRLPTLALSLEDPRLTGLTLSGTMKDIEPLAAALGLAGVTATPVGEEGWALTPPPCRASHQHHNRFTEAKKLAEEE